MNAPRNDPWPPPPKRPRWGRGGWNEGPEWPKLDRRRIPALPPIPVLPGQLQLPGFEDDPEPEQ